MPGQIATPVRLGRARQGIFSPGVPELAGLDAERIVQARSWLLCLFLWGLATALRDAAPWLCQQVRSCRSCHPANPTAAAPCLQVSAGRFMSAAVTAAGEIWTFGGGFNGEQFSGGASLATGPRRVDGILAQVGRSA